MSAGFKITLHGAKKGTQDVPDATFTQYALVESTAIASGKLCAVASDMIVPLPSETLATVPAV